MAIRQLARAPGLRAPKPKTRKRLASFVFKVLGKLLRNEKQISKCFEACICECFLHYIAGQ